MISVNSANIEFSFIFEDFYRSSCSRKWRLSPYLLPNCSNCHSSSAHLHEPACRMRSLFIFIFIFLIVRRCQKCLTNIGKHYVQIFYYFIGAEHMKKVG